LEGNGFKKMFWIFKTPRLLNWLLKPEFQEVDRGKRGIPFRKKNMNSPFRKMKRGRKKHRTYSDKIEK